VLLALHAVIAAHVAHYALRGRTLTPIEPSESMSTLELGQVNAGFVFFVAALAATLVFGRFVCGWGCHIVALQDLCGFLMKRLGIRPKPFRSRLLLWVPAVVATYMFVWPTARRLALGWLARAGWIDPAAAPAPFPGFELHLTTDAFWATFPGPLFAVLTLVTCGFAAVYVLGAKGFCTYGCPYGALFGGLDRLSPGRIVVSDACEQCGHCTATCTSNVRVHEEVRLYGRVVDPGCMKCMDCVSVCPKGALSFAFARPSILERTAPRGERARRYPLGLGAELLLGGVCLFAVFAYRGLYDGPPLLMSVGLGGITAFLALTLGRLLRAPAARLQNLTLKRDGRVTRAGRVFALAATVWLAVTAHSAAVQWERMRGRQELQRTEASRIEALTGRYRLRNLSPAHDRAVGSAHRHFSRAQRWGLVDVLEIELGLAWTHLLRDEVPAAEARLRAAVALQPEEPRLHDHVIDLLVARGRPAEAIVALEEKMSATGVRAADHFRVGGLLVEAGRGDEALEHYRSAASLAPDSAPTRYNLGGLLRRLGRPAEATVELEIAARLAPGDAATQIELGLALAESGRTAEALRAIRRAIDLDPDAPESRLHLPQLIRQLEQETTPGE